MFRKKICEQCKTRYEKTLDECPTCHSKNDEQPKPSQKYTMLSFGKQILLFFCGKFGFEIIGSIIQYIFIFSNDLDTTEKIKNFLSQVKISMAVNALVYIILAIILFLIIFTDIKKLLKSFVSWKPYVAGAVCLLAILTFNFIYGNFLSILKVGIQSNRNETGLDNIVSVYPITSLIIFAIIGPICEELTYRVGLFSFFSRIKKWLAYLITIIIFTFIHVELKGPNIVNELLNIPYYAFAAFAFSFTYDHFGFAGSLTGHMLNNLLSILTQIASSTKLIR